MTAPIIRTSETGWFKALASTYRNRTPVTLIDDAKIGINPSDQSLFQMGVKAKLTLEEWIAVGVSIGIGFAGIAMIILAIVDPEPTSKLGLLVGSGCVCLLGGGFGAVKTLTKERPPNIQISLEGIKISWD
jgi:hypothetical protein